MLDFSYGCRGELVKIRHYRTFVGLFCILYGLGISIAAYVLTPKKVRNSVNRFFLSIFWGIVGLIVLACSKHLEREKGERDTLVKVLWTILLIPLLLLAVFFYNRTVEKRELRKAIKLKKW